MDNCKHCSVRLTPRSEKDRKSLINRCSRLEGQIRGIKGMIENDVYCDDILNQIAAAQSALNSLGKVVLQYHMNHCVADRIKEGDDTVINEFLTTVSKLMR